MLKESQIEAGFIRLAPSKTMKSSGKVVDIPVTPVIEDVIELTRAIKRS